MIIVIKSGILTLMAGILFLSISGCNESPQPTQPGTVITDDDKFAITDRNGKVWDITHAVNEYGFDPEAFDHGIGAFAIRPIQDPAFICPGEANYPGNFEFLVIGYALNDDARAYPISTLASREIANDVFGDAHVSIAY